MNKKGVSDIGKYIISIILFVFVIVGGISIIGMFDTYDGSFVGDREKYETFNSSFNKFDDVKTQTDIIEDKIANSGEDQDFGAFGFLNALIGSAWNTLKLTFSSFSFMVLGMNGLNQVFGVPMWIPTLIGAIITIIIAFAIYKAIFQVQ